MAHDRHCHLSKDERAHEGPQEEIVAQRKLCRGYKTISKSLGVPTSTVRNILMKDKVHCAVTNLTGRGRKPNISTRVGSKLIRDVNNSLRLTPKDSCTTSVSLALIYQDQLFRGCFKSATCMHIGTGRHLCSKPTSKSTSSSPGISWRRVTTSVPMFCGQMRPKLSSLGMAVQPVCGGSQMRLLLHRIMCLL